MPEPTRGELWEELAACQAALKAAGREIEQLKQQRSDLLGCIANLANEALAKANAYGLRPFGQN